MDRRAAIGVGAGSALLAMVVPLRVAHADPPSALRVGGQDVQCPTAMQVATVLQRMLPRTKITADSGPPGAPEATVSDQGARFRVSVAGHERSFDDGARQCAERARHAAVFVAMVLDPPPIAEPPSPAPAAATTVPSVDAPRPRPERVSRGLSWDLTLGGAILVAPEAPLRNTALSQGVVAFARAKRGFYLALGAGILRGALHFDAATADAWWIPVDVAGGFAAKFNLWELGAEIGPSASVLSIVGANLRQAERQLRVEIGGRVSAWSRYWLSHQFAAFLSADAMVRPFPHVLDIAPLGTVGEMPAVWLGASAGVVVALE